MVLAGREEAEFCVEMGENTPHRALTGRGRIEGGRGVMCFQFGNVTVIDLLACVSWMSGVLFSESFEGRGSMDD